MRQPAKSRHTFLTQVQRGSKDPFELAGDLVSAQLLQAVVRLDHQIPERVHLLAALSLPLVFESRSGSTGQALGELGAAREVELLSVLELDKELSGHS
jgi:hypothetical protein